MTCILQQLCIEQPEHQPAGTLEASSDCAENKSLMLTSDSSLQETNKTNPKPIFAKLWSLILKF